MPAQVPVKTKDYLEQDAPIRGQNYACMSFVSPEDVIADKGAFAVKKFLESFAASAGEALSKAIGLADPDSRDTLEALRANYSYVFSAASILEAHEKFVRDNEEKITTEFDAGNDFRTSVRGIKIRGCYETLDEARKRGENLIKNDPKFHVFIGEVGCWCPWSPNPDEIKDEVFRETQLNTLVKEYKENSDSRQAEFAKRKDEMIRKATYEGQRPEGEGEGEGSAPPDVEEVITVGGISRRALEAPDPWQQSVGA